MRISDWSSDVCSSDLPTGMDGALRRHALAAHCADKGRDVAVARVQGSLGMAFHGHCYDCGSNRSRRSWTTTALSKKALVGARRGLWRHRNLLLLPRRGRTMQLGLPLL